MAELSRLGQPDQSGWTTLDRIGAAARKAREYISPWGVVSPTDVAGFAPGGGLVQAWQDSGRGLANLKAGNYGQAAADYGSMALNTIGEVVPYAKLAAILAPAAKYGPDIWTGASHGKARGHMMRDLPDAEIDKAMSEVVSGFIDSKKGFVDRNKAFDIARREGQLLPHIMDKRGELDSAMLIGNGRTTLPPVPDELLSEYNRLQAGARISDIGKVEPQGITAYHGSPHDFDRFDMSKIGTGEGAQAFGHGMYFAEAEDVARGYRNKLTDNRNDYFYYVDGEKQDFTARNFDWNDPWQRAVKMVAENNGDIAKVEARLNEWIAKGGSASNPVANAKDELMALGLLKGTKIEQRTDSVGKLYQVRINANPDDFLDWDKPLSEQSEAVRKALSKAAPDAMRGGGPAYKDSEFNNKFIAPLKGTLYEKMTRPALEPILSAGPEGAKPFIDLARQNDPASAAIFERLVQQYNSPTGAQVYSALTRESPSVAGINPSASRGDEVSAALREAGIPGIKYLDAGSRGAGDGTRNYVVFDDKMVEILKKYGWVPGMAIPAAAMMEYQQQGGSAPQM